jgi:hypothetical protein
MTGLRKMRKRASELKCDGKKIVGEKNKLVHTGTNWREGKMKILLEKSVIVNVTMKVVVEMIMIMIIMTVDLFQ